MSSAASTPVHGGPGASRRGKHRDRRVPSPSSSERGTEEEGKENTDGIEPPSTDEGEGEGENEDDDASGSGNEVLGVTLSLMTKTDRGSLTQRTQRSSASNLSLNLASHPTSH